MTDDKDVAPDVTPDVETPAAEAEQVKDDAKDTVTGAVDKVEDAAESHEPTPDVPEWGQNLIDRVDSLAQQLSTPVEEAVDNEPPTDGETIVDTSPVKGPWHKRKILG